MNINSSFVSVLVVINADEILVRMVRGTVKRGGRVVAGWGALGGFRGRSTHVLEIVRPLADLWALEINADGSPKHPLYIRADQQPFIWQRRAA